jgi:hypothetical protein
MDQQHNNYGDNTSDGCTAAAIAKPIASSSTQWRTNFIRLIVWERGTSSAHPLHLWLVDFFASRNPPGLYLVLFTCSAAGEVSFRWHCMKGRTLGPKARAGAVLGLKIPCTWVHLKDMFLETWIKNTTKRFNPEHYSANSCSTCYLYSDLNREHMNQ